MSEHRPRTETAVGGPTDVSGLPPDPRPALRIVSGRPSAEEIAAVSAVLSAAAGGGVDEPLQPVGGWSDLGRRLRRPLPTGPGAWRNSHWQ